MSGSDEHISSMGHTRQGGFSDSDDYISIESGKSVCVCVCVCVYTHFLIRRCIALAVLPHFHDMRICHGPS